MPVVGTSAYNTAGQITSLVRSLLNDAAGNLFTDGVLMPYANSAYRKVQRALANIQSGAFLSDDVLLVVSAVGAVDPSLQVSITDATAPPNQLPTDLLVPLKLWERRERIVRRFYWKCSTSPVTCGGLALTAAGRKPQVYWEWRADGLYFLGATQDTQIRLRYEKAYPDFVDATSPVLVRNAQEAIAFFAAAMASAARVVPQVSRWDETGADALEDRLAQRDAARTTNRTAPPSVQLAKSLTRPALVTRTRERKRSRACNFFNPYIAHAASPPFV